VYVTEDLKRFIESKGIIHKCTPPYSSDSNGVADCLARTTREALSAILESAETYTTKSWAEAVLTIEHIKYQQLDLVLKGQTLYKVSYGLTPSIQHLQPFSKDCHMHVPYQKRKNGTNLSPRPQTAICTGSTNTLNHYRDFIPNTKYTIVLADIVFTSLKTDGASPLIHHQIHQFLTSLQSKQTTLEYTYTNQEQTSDDFWRYWMTGKSAASYQSDR
jgi:hypothetical protein